MSHGGRYILQISCCFSFLTGQEIVGDKITLGIFSNETDWSQKKIDIKVRRFNSCTLFVVIPSRN